MITEVSILCASANLSVSFCNKICHSFTPWASMCICKLKVKTVFTPCSRKVVEVLTPLILKRGIGWTRVVSLALQPLIPEGKKLRHSFSRRPDGLQSRSGRFGEETGLPSTAEVTRNYRYLDVQPVA
jgi:hypothetical protein